MFHINIKASGDAAVGFTRLTCSRQIRVNSKYPPNFTQANTNDRATSSKWKFSIWFFEKASACFKVILKGLFFLFLHYWYLTFVFLSGNKINTFKKKSYQLCTVILGKEECWTTHCMNIFLWSRLRFSLNISLRVVSHWLICIYTRLHCHHKYAHFLLH